MYFNNPNKFFINNLFMLTNMDNRSKPKSLNNNNNTLYNLKLFPNNNNNNLNSNNNNQNYMPKTLYMKKKNLNPGYKLYLIDFFYILLYYIYIYNKFIIYKEEFFF